MAVHGPVNRTGSPQCFSQFQISHKLNTIQNMHIIYKLKICKPNPKLSPFGTALEKNGK